MGIRDSINQRPRLVTAVTVGVIVLSLIAIVIQQRALPSRGARHVAPPESDAPGGVDRPVGDDQQQSPGRRPAAEPGPRAIARPHTTLG